MPTLAATATADASTNTAGLSLGGIIFLALVVVTLGYIGACWLKPFKRCKHCQFGYRQTAILKRQRPCGWCDATGWRLRAGRRIYNHLRSLRQAAR